ncbi:hypothetical protein [Streptomyces sp. NBC_00690]|uniref:hypothetical protein n=1 Tax=Streptomyces sp. NBC_00690 TaxID=2975808 RepID=UPI002E2C9FBC|nr:hypothetical protein [Streptomyces sp. NBC_00690]
MPPSEGNKGYIYRGRKVSKSKLTFQYTYWKGNDKRVDYTSYLSETSEGGTPNYSLGNQTLVFQNVKRTDWGFGADLLISGGDYDGYYLSLSPQHYLQARSNALRWHFEDEGPYYTWSSPDYEVYVRITSEKVKGSDSVYLRALAGKPTDYEGEFNIKVH